MLRDMWLLLLEKMMSLPCCIMWANVVCSVRLISDMSTLWHSSLMALLEKREKENIMTESSLSKEDLFLLCFSSADLSSGLRKKSLQKGKKANDFWEEKGNITHGSFFSLWRKKMPEHYLLAADIPREEGGKNHNHVFTTLSTRAKCEKKVGNTCWKHRSRLLQQIAKKNLSVARFLVFPFWHCQLFLSLNFLMVFSNNNPTFAFK